MAQLYSPLQSKYRSQPLLLKRLNPYLDCNVQGACGPALALL